MRRPVAVLAGLFLFVSSSCDRPGALSEDVASSPAGPESEQIARFQAAAKAKMKDSLRDPGSARYRQVRAYRAPGGGFVFCGEVNAKNRMGGYTGFERFIASPGIVGAEANVEGFAQAWDEFCRPARDAGRVRF